MRIIKIIGFTSITTCFVLAVLVGVDQLSGRWKPAVETQADFIQYHRGIREKIATDASQPKERDEYRIHLFGGSTMAGVPYETLLDGWLKIFLTEINPEKNIRVSNYAVGAGGSYRASRLIEDSLTQKTEGQNAGPDVVILYSGHNEFLDFDNYTMLRIEHSSWPWLLDGIRQSWLINKFFTQDKGYVVTRHRLVSYDGVKRKVKKRFQASLERVIRLSHEAKVPLVLCNPASNLSFWPPMGKRAPGLYVQAKNFDKNGDQEKALQYYTMARDHDAMATRAKTAITTKILDVKKSDTVEVIDFHHAFIKEGEGKAPGENLFLDNCHPNVRGTYILARGMARSVQKFLNPDKLIFHQRFFEKEKYNWARELSFAQNIMKENTEEEAFLAANLYTHNDDPIKAQQVLSDAINKYPDSTMLRIKLVSVLWLLENRQEESVTLLKELLKNPDNLEYAQAHRKDTYYFRGLEEVYLKMESTP